MPVRPNRPPTVIAAAVLRLANRRANLGPYDALVGTDEGPAVVTYGAVGRGGRGLVGASDLWRLPRWGARPRGRDRQ
jgi:hypothetical protein